MKGNAVGVKRVWSNKLGFESCPHQVSVVHTVCIDHAVIILSMLQYALLDNGFMTFLHDPADASSLALIATAVVLNRR